MKMQNRQVIVFILMIALTFSWIIPQASALEGGSSASDGVSQTQKSLKDIKGHWGEKAILKALDYGFVQGYEDGNFRPDKPVRRAEFVTMVNKALKLREENTLKLRYSDVKDSDWFFKEIQKASYARYVSGIDKTTFMPKKEITRQEAAAMLARILPKDGPTSDIALDGYKDADQISSWAKSAVAMVVSEGYLNGYSLEKLGPKATLSRAEAAKIIGLILEKETIVREDVSVRSVNETLKGKIFIGDITIEKSLGEGDAVLENITALSKVYVLGGGTSTIKVSNSTIIQLVVCKEGTKVRVLSDGETSIYNAFVFNNNLLVNSSGQNAETGEGSYFNVIRLNGNISAETAIKIAAEIAKWLPSSGQITQDQLREALSEVAEGFEISINSSGSLEVNLPKNIQIKSSFGSNKGMTINGKPAVLSELTGNCPCGLSLTSPGAFTKGITFYPSSGAVSTVTGFAIYTEAQLQHLAVHPDSNAVLMKDLDFAQYSTGSSDPSTPMGALKIANQAGLYTTGHDISNFETGKFVPIGTYAHAYRGSFDGNGKIITGLEVSCSMIDKIGLFGFASGAGISDLTISGGMIFGGDDVGAIIGRAQGGTIESCKNSAIVSGINCVGGVAGFTRDNSTIKNSNNTGTVYGSDRVGGVVGSNYSAVLNSGNSGSVTGSGEVGGIAGFHYGSPATIENCFNTGAVSGLDRVGGVAGYCYYHSAIKNSYNTGAVFGNDNVGGLAGLNYYNTILNSFNTGTYSGSNYAGSLTGSCDHSSINHCYWLEGTNAIGIGASSASAATSFPHSSSTLAEVYSSIAAIASSNSIATIGAVSGIDFGSGNMNPPVFNPLQGSYITSASSLMITISAISGTSIKVESGASLLEIASSGGNLIEPTVSGGAVYELSGLSPGTWVVIKAENAAPAKIRYYTLFIEPIVDTITANGNPALISAVSDHCSCGLALTSPGAFTKEIIFYPGSEATSTVTGFAIYTEAQLQHLAAHPHSNAVLMNDLDFSQYTTGSSDPATPMGALKIANQAGFYTTGHAISNFETGKFVPIGVDLLHYRYDGVFCGNGKVITGLIISCSDIDNVGLFGDAVSAEISGLTISGGSITGVGSENVGAIAGSTTFVNIENCCNSATVSGEKYVGGVAGLNYNESTISNSCNEGAVSGRWYVGGIAGQNYCADIKNSNNAGIVTGTGGNIGSLGGVAGENNFSTIEKCSNTGRVSGLDLTGGVAGANYNHSTILDSYNTGAVTGDYRIGGVVGKNYNIATVSDCYNTGAVSGKVYIGGVIGLNGEVFYNYWGNATVSDCYNTGSVSGNATIGGLVAINDGKGTFLDSFNTGVVSGSTDVGGVIGYYKGGNITNCNWLEGTNANGIGTGSGITVFSFDHSGSTLAEVYSNMAAITESAGNDSGGAVSGIVFGGSDMIPAAFDQLQGSYIFSQSNQNFSVYTILDDVTVIVKIGASLSEVMSSGGTFIEPIALGGDEYNLTGLSAGKWVLIKAEDALQPEKTRFYTFFRRNW